MKSKSLMAMVLTVALGLSAAGPVWASPDGEMHGPCREMMQKRGMKGADRMASELNLTDDQRVKVKQIMESHHESMKAQREQMMKQMDAVLTPEQQQKAKEMRARHKKHDSDEREG